LSEHFHCTTVQFRICECASVLSQTMIVILNSEMSYGLIFFINPSENIFIHYPVKFFCHYMHNCGNWPVNDDGWAGPKTMVWEFFSWMANSLQEAFIGGSGSLEYIYFIYFIKLMLLWSAATVGRYAPLIFRTHLIFQQRGLDFGWPFLYNYMRPVPKIHMQMLWSNVRTVTALKQHFFGLFFLVLDSLVKIYMYIVNIRIKKLSVKAHYLCISNYQVQVWLNSYN